MAALTDSEAATAAGPTRRWQALAAGAALAGIALLGATARLASTPAAIAMPALSALGPGNLGQLRARMLAGGQGMQPGSLAAASQRALRQAPLAYEPFLATAAEGFLKPGSVGGSNDAQLLNEAIRRNKRAREARVLLMRNALASGNLTAAVEQIAALARLNHPGTDVMVQSLGKAIATPSQVDEALTAFASHPELYRAFLLGFSANTKTDATALRLAKGVPSQVLANSYDRGLVISSLIRARAYGPARAIWAQYASAQQGQLVHSPDFTGSIGAAPFGWKLTADETGAAERTGGRGISVSYYGRQRGELVSQLLTLAPGTYQLGIRYQTQAGTPGMIHLRLSCAANSMVIGEAPLNAAPGPYHLTPITVTVPAQNCPAQLLALNGEGDESRNSQDIAVKSISVVRQGGR